MQIPLYSVIYLIVGIIFLTSGRRLFWLFVACAGFILGFEYGGSLTGIQDQWIILIIAVSTGLVGALVAIFLQGIAVGVAGFLIGGFASINLLELTGYFSEQYFLPIFIAGGIIGLILMLGLFDYALIFLSSIVGAFVIVHTFYLTPPVKMVVFLLLAMSGAVFQARVHPRTFRKRR
jgi:hypothetical protein